MAHPTFVQAGFSGVSNKGHTMHTLFDLHIGRRWASSTQSISVHGLAVHGGSVTLIGTLAKTMDFSANPAEHSYDYVLPFGCAYERLTLTAQRMEGLSVQ